MDRICEDLLKLIGEKERVVPGDRIEEKYLSDTLGRLKGKAQALVFAESAEEVSRVMKYAYENGIAVTPRGAGTCRCSTSGGRAAVPSSTGTGRCASSRSGIPR